MPITEVNDALAISETRQRNIALRFEYAMENPIFARDSQLRAAVSEPKTHSFYSNSGDLTRSTRKSLGIAIVRFWCAECGASLSGGSQTGAQGTCPQLSTSAYKSHHFATKLYKRAQNQCSLVYPYPSVSDFAGRNSDHGPSKTQAKT